MATRIRTLNFLPEIFKTETNAQFLAATLDQLVAQPNTKKIEGYIGSKFGYGVNAKDYYVTEPTKVRTDYQLDPGVVFLKENQSTAKDFISYPGIIDALKSEGGVTGDNNRLFNSQFYSWDSFTNLDPIINFNQYYWLPEGPERVVVAANVVYNTSNYIIQDESTYYLISSETNATPSINPSLTLLRGGTYTFTVNQATQFWIQGEPGITGYSSTQHNVQTRDVYGVENNGASQGVVTFTVPEKNALADFDFPGNNTVDVVSTLPFSQVNGAFVNDIGGIDGVTALDGLTVMFYNTGVYDETGFVQTFFSQTEYDTNDNVLVAPLTITATATSSVNNTVTCDTTSSLIEGQTITFTGTEFGGLTAYSTTSGPCIYTVTSIVSPTEFTIEIPGSSNEPGGIPLLTLTDASGTMTGNINEGLYEEGFYTTVSGTFYRISLLGSVDDPFIQLTRLSNIPATEKITASFGTQWGSRNFYRSNTGVITLYPYNSAILDVLYYQDGTNPNKVGILNIVDNNLTNTIDVVTDILGKPTYTAPNGVVFTNGLKVLFQGNITPASYDNVEYYVEGVGTAIELIPVTTLVSPGLFSAGEYIPYDTTSFDIGNYDSSLYIPVDPDYITIARNSINRNPWSRSNRWFHIDVINASATYNNNPDLVTLYTQVGSKAKRPIIEFYPNIRLFDAGIVGKDPIDFIDSRTTDAFTDVAGQPNYYPDVAGWTTATATIAAVTGAITSKTATDTYALINQVALNNTVGLHVNDTISFGTSFGGITSGTTYSIASIVDNKITLNDSYGNLVPLSNAGPVSVSTSIYPYSTTITVPTTDLSGLFEVGQYISDSTLSLPEVTFITEITTLGTDTILTVSWYQETVIIPATSIAALVTADTPLSNYGLFDGSRIVFAADTNLEVRNKIYISRFSTISPGSTPVITLTEADDGVVLANEQTAVYRGYNYIGKDFYFTGYVWIEGQQKTTLNQAPRFDVFDSNNISFGDPDVYVGTSFTGCTLFSYGLGVGANDAVLGFPVRYSSVNNIGDISFDVTLNSATFNYVKGTVSETQKVNTGYVYNYTLNNYYGLTEVRQLGWQTAVSPSVQYQIFEFDWNAITDQTEFTCDVAPIANPTTNWPLIQVYINNIYLPKDQWTFTSTDTTTTIYIPTIDAVETVIQVLILSDQVSTTAYYEPPINLTNNPLNQDLTSANIGDIRGQYQSIFFNNPNTTGEVFGPNNYRDLGNLVPWGNRIIQNSAGLPAVGTFLRNQSHDIFNSLLYNSRQYITFKTLLVDTVNNSDYSRMLSPSEMLDLALDQINAPHTNDQPFFWSDMLPSKAPYITNTYSFANSLDVSIYPLSHIYNFATANYNGILVYLIRNGVQTQLVKGVDYTVSTDSPSLTITTDLLPNDQITIKEYNQTYGNYVPNTPTKLGLYPATIPSVVLDTAYNPETYFIVGHDGSFNKLYGAYNSSTNTLTDFRDQVLLEYETRVYNNLKLSETAPAGSYQGVVIPGFFRQTDYTYNEFLEIYSESFLNWVGQNRINYAIQFYNVSNQFSYNYRDSGIKLNNAPIEQGYFRGLYLYFYDTSTPNETPWEMLGLSNKPTWWETRYGPSPYTSDNLILWGDLAAGLVWNDGNPYIKPSYAREGLLDIIPVDSNGDLLSPFDSIVGNYDANLFKRDWMVGDVGPAEFSYRRSSTWPFDLMRILALTKPADFFNLGIDVDNYKYNTEFDQYLVGDRSHLVLSDIPIYGNGTPATSYINWIVDYEKQVGVDATTNITKLLDNLDVRLVYRLAGFSDKNLLKFYVEKSSANSNNSSLLIPDESYAVLLYENQPFDRIIYSGVVVQITENGYKIYGNSQTHAYFTVLVPKFGGSAETITVENETVSLTSTFYNKTEEIPYGTEFYNIQQVSQFLINYGEYLKSQGMVYEQIENGIPINWQQMVAEFLYWAQTGWSIGSVTTINPAATFLSIDKESRIVQPLTLQQHNFVLNQNLYPIQNNDLSIVRDGTAFTLQPLNTGDAISYGQFNISNIEHGIVFDNTTLFNDTIYNLVTGLRQNRIYVRGTKTAEWNGNIDASGFILNQDNIVEWVKEIKYTTGSIVKYKNKYWTALTIIQAKEIFDERDWKQTSYHEIQKGLLPNSQTRSYESTLYYDINKANLENDADLLSFSLIGYRPRDYMALADLTDITQVNVYQNMIKTKGTPNAANAFKGANLPQGGIDYTIYENWAIKSGEFGGILNNNFIEFRLSQPDLTGNPSIVGLTNGNYTESGVQQEVTLNNVFNYGRPITSPEILPTISSLTPSTLYPTAGYVNFNDVKLASYYYSGLGTGQNSAGTYIPISEFYVRDYAWLASYLGTWQVYTPISLGPVINAKNNLNGTVTITFGQAHNLKRYQPFAIVNFNVAIDNYYLVSAIVDPFNVIINLTLNPQLTNVNGLGIGFKLQSQRVATAPEIENLPLLDNEFNKLKVWVDTNNDGGWAVFRKSLNYQYGKEILKAASQTFGSAVAYTTALGYLIGDSSAGKVYRYAYDNSTDSYLEKQTITEGTSFGSNITYIDDLFVVSEPTGTPTVHIYQLITTALLNTLLPYQTIAAPGGITNWGSSTALSGDQNWLYISDTEHALVYVYRKSEVTSLYEQLTESDGVTPITLSVAGLTSADGFGYSISTDYYGDTVVVGAPQQDYDVNTQNYGYTYIFSRTVQNFEAQTSSQAYVPLLFNLVWTPGNLSTTANTISSNAITLGSVGDLQDGANGTPIVFTGTPYGGIAANTVYYVKQISGSTITLSLTRNGTVLTLTNSTGTMTATGQTSPLFLTVNGTTLADNLYAVVGSRLNVYSTATPTLNAGDIINVSGTNFVLTQTLTNEETPRVGVQFGTSTTTNRFANEILIGAPFELSSQNYEGAIHRYTNGGERYGTIIGTTTCNITSPRTILLNGYAVTLPIGNATAAVNAINSNSITNVTASAVAGKLIISLVDVSLAVAGNKLSLSVLDTDTLAEMGVIIYKQTQKIACPHLTGRTQFGTVVKFNSSGSFVASAPVGARYSATTFDFTDDELDNDTVFDNNATQWVDTFTNAGAVYMFDYLSTYNENINAPGKFVYAQSINAQDFDYGSQPHYGTALDFNDNVVTVGTPGFNPNTNPNDTNGQVVTYISNTSDPDWAVYRSSSDIVDIAGVFNVQLFSATTNNTLENLDYLDPLQGKLLGAVAENIDVVSNVDPASYNSVENQAGLVWGADKIGTLWFDTSSTRFMNYHQNDVSYNSQWWGRVFPGSNVVVYSWVASNVVPSEYTGPGVPYSDTNYTIRGVVNPEGLITPVYYFWARNTNIVFNKIGKTLADTTLEYYIGNPQGSGISYLTPLLPNVFGLYNCFPYINAKDTVLHIGYSTSTNNDATHNQYSLIRVNYPDDFLPGIPGSGAAYQNHASVGITEPIGLYNRMLDSMCGVDNAGGVVPDPLLPKAVQTGVLARPRQGFFYNRFGALKNYLQYANVILSQFPIVELRNPELLDSKNPEIVDDNNNVIFAAGEKYNTKNYWSYVNWWATGYDNNTKSSLQVPIYADLSTLSVPAGTIVTVAANGAGNSETYIYNIDTVGNGTWVRIGLENGTIEFDSVLWDYPSARLGFGDNFFDTTPYDEYPSTETRYIVRALNEQIYTNELLIFRNKSLILLFEYIQSETIESQNYLEWLNKTSFIDVSHTIRELIPLEVYRSDNQLFLEGYLNEVKPYHVVIKEFIFKYTKTDIFEGDITDFDLPAQYNSTIDQFVTPELVYSNPSGDNQYLPSDPIWQTAPYSQWYNNYGVAITGQSGYKLALLDSYLTLNSTSCYVDNINGFPVTGTILIGEEQIAYSAKNLATSQLVGLSRGVNNTTITVHFPNDTIHMDLPAVVVLNEGRGYTNPPTVTAYIDTTIYPAPRVPAQLEPIMSLDSVIGVNVINPGEGYVVLPNIKIDPAITISINSSRVNVLTNTIELPTLLLQTGDLVVYTIPTGSTKIDGLLIGQQYYVNVLELSPVPLFALYDNYLDAINDHDRIPLITQGSGIQYFSQGAIATSVTSAIPVRENNISLRFDRTTYNTNVLTWQGEGYYGSFYAGTLSNSNKISSSSITLQNTQPPISSVLASAQGAAFEILDVQNEQSITWSSRTRNTVQTYGPTYPTAAYRNAIRINPNEGGAEVAGQIGSTIGFYIGMPIKFVGSTTGTSLVSSNSSSETIYYVKSLVQLPNLSNPSLFEDTGFTISDTINEGVPGDVYSPSTGSASVTLSTTLTLYVGQETNLAIMTINYDGIRTSTNTTTATNTVTVQLTPTGQNGTTNFYTGLPIFFTGNVFGGIEENQTYYVTSVVDNQTFTMSTSTDPVTFEITETESINDSITCETTVNLLSINDPIIFSGDVFGNIVAGKTYYVRELFTNNTSFSISESINGSAFPLSNDTGSCVLTSQSKVLQLTTATGSMTLNVGLPISPGQINGQEFTLYETSTQYNGVTGTVSNLLTRSISATLSTVNRICLLSSNTLDNIYENLEFTIDKQVGGLSTATPYTITSDFGTTSVDVSSTTSTGDWLIINTSTNPDSTNVLYVGMPLYFSGTSLGGISLGVVYYVYAIDSSPPSGQGRFKISENINLTSVFSLNNSNGSMTGTGDPYITIAGSLLNSSQLASSITVADPAVVTVSNGAAFPNGTAIKFTTTGTLPTPLTTELTYYVRNRSGNTFNVSYTPTSSLIKTTVAGTGTFNVIQTPVQLTQYINPANHAEFDVSYILGGYSSIITDPGLGYTINNVITIDGASLGGVTGINDLYLTVSMIDGVIPEGDVSPPVSNGEITAAISSGTPAGATDQYYFKVISESQVSVYSNPNLTVAVSGQNFAYNGITSTAVTSVLDTGNVLNVTSSSSFSVNDPVVFTNIVSATAIRAGQTYQILTLGNTEFTLLGALTNTVGQVFVATTTGSGTGTAIASVYGGIIAGETYYIKTTPSSTSVTISETLGGSPVNIPSDITGSMTMAKSGDYALLPEPFFFNPSIVKYNNRVYQCIISNNDTEFIFGKWELLDSGDFRLNALDRIEGYYHPTVNMPGMDMTQLVAGITYPNSTYLGNAFAPADEFTLDAIIQDQPFYVTGLNLKAIVWNGLNYIAGADTNTYSSFNVSVDGLVWTINNLANQPLGITDMLYAGGNYIITTNNNATPILISDNGYNWITNGTFTPYDSTPYDLINFDVSLLSISSLSLSSVAYYNGIYVAVGTNIVTSTDLYSWTERHAFTGTLSNIFNGVTYVSTGGFTGFVAVGAGQRLVNGIVVNVAIIFTSTDGYVWSQVPFTSTVYGFNSIAANNQTITAVGDNGIIYTSFNCVDWFVQSSGTTNDLNNIIWDNYNNIFVVVGEAGKILTSPTSGGTWTSRTSGTTQTLESVVYNNTDGKYLAVGLNNTILSSTNTITWTSIGTFETPNAFYTIQGDSFEYGYGPEELVPGVVSDTLTMVVSTRPGTNWDDTVYQHVGYNVVSTEIAPTSQIQTNYSFANLVINPAQLAVFVIHYDTGLSTSLYEGADYTIDWINNSVILNTPINYFIPGTDILRIDVYEVGNGDQLVKTNSTANPIRINETTGFQEIYVNANYSASIYQGSGIMRPETSPIYINAIATSSTYNTITCDSVNDFVLNSPITFSGAVFGGIVEDQVYYVKSIGGVSNRITISETYNVGTGTAGETFELTTATGIMEVVIKVGTGAVWTTPAIYHNGTPLILGTTAPITRTRASTNTITTITTSSLIPNTPIVFSDTIFGGVLNSTTVYYIKTIYDSNEFSVSLTAGGDVLELTDATGGALFITNDYAIGLASNGISAAIMLAADYDDTVDYLSYTLFGQTIPIQYGYTIPQVQTFSGDGSSASFALTNYVGGDNPYNSIVEIDGLRQNESSYTIDSNTNTIVFTPPPADGSTIAVTSYNLTDRQYFNTQYNITGSGTLSSITVTSTTNSLSTYDQNTPTVQTFDEDSPSIVLYDQVLNYLSTADTSTLQIDYPVTFNSPTLGGLVAGKTYFITAILNSTDFQISAQVGGSPVEVTTDSGTMTGVINGLTVSNITNINNNISLPTTSVTVGSTLATGNYVVCNDNTTLESGQEIIFKAPISPAGTLDTVTGSNQYQIVSLGDTDWTAIGASADPYVGEKFTATGPGSGTGTALLINLGGIDTTGKVYTIGTKNGSTDFTILDEFGTVTLINASGSLVGYMGGVPAIRVTTGIVNRLVEDQLVRIDGVVGSTQLNNNVYYVHIINAYEFDLYLQPYNPALNATNYPVTYTSSYVSGGYVWVDGLFTVADTTAISTTSVGNRITVASTDSLINGTPIIFTEFDKPLGYDILGGILSKTTYYLLQVRPEIDAGKFISDNEYEITYLGTTDWNAIGYVGTPVVGGTFTASGLGTGNGLAKGLQEITITADRYPNELEVVLTDATVDPGITINVSQFEQVNVDRLWVTVNGARVPSSSLRLNPYNDLSILTTINTGDVVIVTSMMPTATPNEEVYVLNVGQTGSAAVYRANTQTRTWLVHELKYSDDMIYFNDISRITDTVVQDVTCPAEVDGKYNIGLTSNKNVICHMVVYNNTTSVEVSQENYKIIIVNTAPILQISAQVAENDSLTVTSIEGRLVWMDNGELIGFGECDLANNTVSKLTRGAGGTGVQPYTPIYSQGYGLTPNNRMTDVLYKSTWNPIPGVYNTTEGDPLQIADTDGANFLRGDIN